eukprot:9017498-Pyramimonas_sp.AAC.1
MDRKLLLCPFERCDGSYMKKLTVSSIVGGAPGVAGLINEFHAALAASPRCLSACSWTAFPASEGVDLVGGLFFVLSDVCCHALAVS